MSDPYGIPLTAEQLELALFNALTSRPEFRRRWDGAFNQIYARNESLFSRVCNPIGPA